MHLAGSQPPCQWEARRRPKSLPLPLATLNRYLPRTRYPVPAQTTRRGGQYLIVPRTSPYPLPRTTEALFSTLTYWSDKEDEEATAVQTRHYCRRAPHRTD
ncbi:hypothetical protein N5P37_002659 [Trichoderma harzianum]|nr:hypothetical protein N5P37_002659 [Trichoderma harzianum]